MSSADGACDCCVGVGDLTPVHLDVRPGLSAIAYRVGTHPEFLASMIAGLTDADRPRLADLAARDSDDFTIALLDAWAVVADVLTFYSERVAQESYLRTARDRVSLQELGRLIGYRMRPGAAAETQLAFAIQAPPDVPVGTSQDPGSAPPVTPAIVTLERGLRVQSIPGPGEQPQTFETVEEVDARPEWNAMAASTTIDARPANSATTAWLRGAALNLKPGDDVLFVGGIQEPTPVHWDRRFLTRVEPDPAFDRTKITWHGPVFGSKPEISPAIHAPLLFVMRKRSDVFGHAAPAWSSMSHEFQSTLVPAGTTAEKWPKDWPEFTTSPEGAKFVDVEGSHPEIVSGSLVMLSIGGGGQVFIVDSSSEHSRAQFAISGRITRVAFDVEQHVTVASAPRDTKVLHGAEPLEYTGVPNDLPVAGATIEVDADVSGMVPGRRLVVRGTTVTGVEHAETVVLKEVVAAGTGRSQLVLEQALSTAYVRDTVVVHGNVATATHGETVQQLLGAGQARMAFQRFSLAHGPLTYRRSTADDSGVRAELELRVNDVRWDERPALFGAGPDDRAYVVRTDEDGARYVQFGDGVAGARLPSGSNNVRARYRKGLGAAGNVAAAQLAQLIDRPLGAKGVSNPAPATGGVDPEPAAAARGAIPLAVRTLGRAVSLLDYADYARAYTGVAKARAAVLDLRGGRTILVTVAFTGEQGVDESARLADIAASLRGHGDPHVRVDVRGYADQRFQLDVEVAVDPAYEVAAVLVAVESALRDAFGFEARDLAQAVHRSGVLAVAHTVPGVLAVDVDLLAPGGVAPLSQERILAQLPAVDPGGDPVPAGLLVLDPGPLAGLRALQ